VFSCKRWRSYGPISFGESSCPFGPIAPEPSSASSASSVYSGSSKNAFFGRPAADRFALDGGVGEDARRLLERSRGEERFRRERDFASGAGAASRHSFGTAAVGGMLVSTILNLIVIPAS